MTRRANNILFASFAVALTAASASGQAVPNLGNLPLYFEAKAQKDGSAQFLARSRDSQVLISPAGVQLALRNNVTISAQFIGANPQAKIHGGAELSGKINYLTGNDPAKWRTGIPTFAKIQIDNLYPGINAVYYGNQQQLEYDFQIAPGNSPEVIKLRFNGAEKISINDHGQLALTVGQGEIFQPKPVIYQEVGGEKREINGGYKIVDAQTVAFSIGSYDHDLPLVIDPILSYSTYFGGSSGEIAWGVAINTNQNAVFITGQTLSSKFITNGVAFTPAPAFQPNFKGGTFNGDAFVAKFDQQGTHLAYLTYLGGTKEDLANSIAVNQAGNAFVAGFTDSPDFPVTTVTSPIAGVSTNIGGAILSGYYPFDAFVAELSPDGSSLVYSTFLGGSGNDEANSLAIDNANNAYVTGYTFSTNFPVKNAFISKLACPQSYANCNAFVTKINAGGTSLGYSTYLGGTNFDIGNGIAVDGSGDAYVTGYTASTNFPNINSFQAHLNQSTNLNLAFDAFVTELAPGGSTLLYSSFLGSTNNDVAYGITVDNSGAYITGWTTSTAFTNTAAGVIANRITNNISGVVTTNAFLTKISYNAGVSRVAYSAVFGGSLIDIGYGVAVDPAGNAFVTGSTTSGNFPVKNSLGLLRTNNMGGNDAFVTAFNASGSNVLYSIYLGGSGGDFGYGIAVDSASTAYVVGQTSSGNFPTTTNSVNFPIYNALSKSLSGSSDAFLSEILITNFQPALVIKDLKSHNVFLAWQYYGEPEIGLSQFLLESTPNLLMTNLVAGTNYTFTTNSSGGLTVITTTTNKFTITNWVPTTKWATVTNALTISNNFNLVTLPATNPYQFFRLHKP